MGHADRSRRISGVDRRGTHLGPGTSRTLLLDLHATAVAELVSQGRVHHRGLYVNTSVALRCQHCRVDNFSDVVDDSGNSVVDFDGSLHGISLRAGEGARHVAEPVAAAASRVSGAATWFGSLAAFECDVEDRVTGRSVHSLCAV